MVVCLLSDACADEDVAMQGGATPLFIASQSGYLEVVRLLFDARADKDIARGITPNHWTGLRDREVDEGNCKCRRSSQLHHAPRKYPKPSNTLYTLPSEPQPDRKRI